MYEELPANPSQDTQIASPGGRSTASGLVRFVRYAALKAVTLFITVAIGLYLTILVANLGGYVDEIFRGRIEESIAMQVLGGWLKGVEEPERTQQMDAYRAAMEQAMGLNEPFLSRTFRWLVRAITLDLGQGRTWSLFGLRDSPVQSLVFRALPYTLVLVTASHILLFITTILFALAMSGKPGGWLDRLNALLLSFTSAPSWIYGLLLILLLAGVLRWLPFPKNYSIPPSEITPSVAKDLSIQMIMPVLAIFISGFFQGVYAWRSYFLLYREEDYVELSTAKGLPNRIVERRYILRPALPYVLTSFALMVVGAWQGAIALEMIFMWPGVGPLFLGAVRNFNTPILLGVLVIFAYMLALSVFLLDILYALVDPRVRVGAGSLSQRRKPKILQRSRHRRWFRQEQLPHPALERRPALDLPASPTASVATSAIQPRQQTLRASNLAVFWREISRHPSAILGLLFIFGLLAASAYVMIRIPYQEAIIEWRTTGSDWYRNPKNARPVWYNWFRQDKLPPTIQLSTRSPELDLDPGRASISQRLGNLPPALGTVTKVWGERSAEEQPLTLSFTFDYNYGAFPQDITLYLHATYQAKLPYVTVSLLTPDGRKLEAGSLSIASSKSQHYLGLNRRLVRRLGEGTVMQGLFGDPQLENARPLQGTYTLLIDALLFEEQADLDVEMLLQGQVAGLAGTDDQRRDLMLPLLWGTPVALAFGLLAALGTSLLSVIISALGAWLGGWFDALVQRLTELTLILPVLPLAILVFIMYSKTIWAILGVVVVLNIFGSSIKTYRAAFLQMRNEPFIEAAQAYGASGPRIITRYMIPRILPTLIPQIVILIPVYVYYEVTLAFLGVSDPYLPTWGKVIYDAVTSSLVFEYAYWALQPIILLALTSLAFTTLCYSLERVLNPRLRER